MRIVVWNCNMGFHGKYEHLFSLNPDIAIIPECANIERLTKQASAFKPSSAIWIGDNPKKGLGAFTFGQFRAVLSTDYVDGLCPFIAPIEIHWPILRTLR
jgi:hypothetical protein